MPSRKSLSVIACPKCNWQPSGGEEWQCSCGHTWDTFATAGKCPTCQHQWSDTQCLGCFCTSRHAAWYRQLASPAELYVISPN